ncbi:MAG TPA: ABC transporter ATP-binding protein [Chlorobaculum sp.]|nr:ABC transporter ATP-binding protein [Chlorobaculum sp.]
MQKHSVLKLLFRLWPHISSRRRKQFGLMFVFMVAASFAEMLSIGAVLPFLAVLTSPATLFRQPMAQPVIAFFSLKEPIQLILPLTIAFGLAAVVSGAMRVFLIWANTRLSFAAGADLSISIYRRTLYQSYLTHVSRNSSKVISGITHKTGIVTSTFNSVLNFSSSAIILIAILITLIAVDPVVAFSAFSGFGLIYTVIILFTRHSLENNGKRIASEHTNVIKALQEGLGGIRDVLIDSSQELYCQVYRGADLSLRKAESTNIFISSSPRYLIEPLGMLLIAILAYAMSLKPEGITRAIPVLGALALGAQRLLPLLQQAYASWSGTHGNLASLYDVLELLDQPLPDYADKPLPKPLPFNRKIVVNGISFRYNEEGPWVLNEINLSISKGSRIGFIGTTGSGKSTMLDIVMALLPPTRGTLEVDGLPISDDNRRAWQAHIAHVPQAIFLSDSSISQNIAFGVPRDKVDHQRVRQAARQAQIADIIETWPQKYDTVIGERGIRLSGGQRQRIGIARALYKQVDVIILDEATSALDNETEEAVMQSIEALGKDLTILIIAHRLTTLKNCGQIVELDQGRIIGSGNYTDMIENAEVRNRIATQADICENDRQPQGTQDNDRKASAGSRAVAVLGTGITNNRNGK